MGYKLKHKKEFGIRFEFYYINPSSTQDEGTPKKERIYSIYTLNNPIVLLGVVTYRRTIRYCWHSHESLRSKEDWHFEPLDKRSLFLEELEEIAQFIKTLKL